jgi:hypothetical protein
VQTLRRNLTTALDIADSYVWLWGEQCCFWDYPDKWQLKRVVNTVGKGKYWGDAMPGILQAIECSRNPEKFWKNFLQDKSKCIKLKNIAVNSGFENTILKQTVKSRLSDWNNTGAPIGYFSWQDKGSKGIFSWDKAFGNMSKSSAKAVNVLNGCFLQKYKVKPKEHYGVKVDAFLKGRGCASFTIRWQTVDGKWINDKGVDKTFSFMEQSGRWQQAIGNAQVPDRDDVGQMVILLSITGQLTLKDVCWFDNLKVYCLE